MPNYSGIWTLPQQMQAEGAGNWPDPPYAGTIAVAHGTSPYITAYTFNSGSGFGTKYSNPSTLPTSTGRGVAFSPDNSAIAVPHESSPYITAYPWSASGFGTKYSNPSTLPASTGRGVAFGQ